MEIIVADELPLVRVGIDALLLEHSLISHAHIGLNAELDTYLDAGVNDCLLLLGSLPDATLLDVAQASTKRGVRVAVLVTRVTAEEVAGLHLLGITQLCVRHAAHEELRSWIAAALSGVPFESLSLANLAPVRPVESVHDDLLSPREHAVLRLLIEGKSNREIASQLFITVATVKSHIQKIYAKLEVANRNEALGRALALGLIGNR